MCNVTNVVSKEMKPFVTFLQTGQKIAQFRLRESFSGNEKRQIAYDNLFREKTKRSANADTVVGTWRLRGTRCNLRFDENSY